MKEPLLAIIPSFTLGTDGPTLTSLFLFAEHYICEVRVTAGEQEEFDFVRKDRLANLRIKCWRHEVKKDDAASTVFQLAQVALKHSELTGSELNYVGDDRDSWLSDVLACIPMETLLAG